MNFSYARFQYVKRPRNEDDNGLPLLFDLIPYDPCWDTSDIAPCSVKGYAFKKSYLASLGLTETEVQSVKGKQRERGHKKKKDTASKRLNKKKRSREEEEKKEKEVEEADAGTRRSCKKAKKIDEEEIVKEEETNEFDNTLDGPFWTNGTKRTKRKVRLPSRYQ